MKTIANIAAFALVVSAFSTGFQRNESSRISIKRCTDAAAASIPEKAKATTIEEMLGLSRPEGLKPDISGEEYQTKRVGGFENTKWTVDATITEVIKRPDGDFYCVIEGKSGARTVFEAPDPKLCVGSHFLAQIDRVRKLLDDKVHPTAQPQKVNLKVQVTGIGFFGYQGRGQGTAKTNGARLMPVLDINFKD